MIKVFATHVCEMFFKPQKETSMRHMYIPRSFIHVQYTRTDTIRQFRWSIGTNGRIGTNRKECHSNGSVGEYASH